MASKQLTDYLDEHGVRYARISHSPAYTAQEIAEAAHIPGRYLAKTVMVKLDDRIAMAVVPAPRHVDTERLARATGAQQAQIADESEFADLFPGCELGAMPPFGNLWDMPVFVDSALREDEHIAFNAGSNTELIQLALADFERLVQPVPVEICPPPL